MKDTLLYDFAALARRIQENFIPTPELPEEYPEGVGVLVCQRDGDHRAFVIQPFNALMESLPLQDRESYRQLKDIQGLLEVHTQIAEEFSDQKYWTIHQYVQTTRLLVEEGYGVHMYDGDQDNYDVVPPMIFTKPSAPVPVVCIQEVDAEQFKKLLEATQALDHLDTSGPAH